jgi:hypothetical protein
VVDLTGINAYYTLLAMQMNAAQYQAPKDFKRLARFPSKPTRLRRSGTAQAGNAAVAVSRPASSGCVAVTLAELSATSFSISRCARSWDSCDLVSR